MTLGRAHHAIAENEGASFLFGEPLLDLGQCPGVVGAVVVEADVGILGGIETAAGLVGEGVGQINDDAFGGVAVERFAGEAIRLGVGGQQFGLHVGHLLEVGDVPEGVSGVAVEAAVDVVAQATAGHALEGFFRHLQQPRFAGGRVALQGKLHDASVGELGGAGLAAVLRIELLPHSGNELLQQR